MKKDMVSRSRRMFLATGGAVALSSAVPMLGVDVASDSA